MRILVALALTCAFTPALYSQARGQAPSALQIVVIEGEAAVNIIQQKTAVAPLIEVRDRNNQPVAGVAVTFTILGGRNAAFAAGGNSMAVTTNALGQAAVSGLTPTSAGAVQINVAAAFQGQTATAAITQTNVMTAAQAASASSSGASGASAGGGGGGGIGAGTITALSAAAVGGIGGWYGYKKYQQGDPPELLDIGVPFTNALVAIMPVVVTNGNSTWHGEGAVMRVDFGDGFQTSFPLDFTGSAGPAATHAYSTAGTYTIRGTLVDAWDRTSSAQASVTIRDLNGRWNLGTTGSFFTLVQSGLSMTGTFTAANGQGSGVVTGTAREMAAFATTANNFVLSVTPTGTGPASVFTGTTGFNNTDSIFGTFTSGATVSNVNLNRQ